MSGMTTTAVPVRDAILDELRPPKEHRPSELLRVLCGKGYAESDIKEALSGLLREGVIELTSQRILRSVNQNAA
jgi:hypothetical protein